MRSSRQTIFVPALATVLMLGVGEAAQATCYGTDQELPAHVLSRFIDDPGRLLSQFPDGGPQMISSIRDLVASDPGSLPLIISLNARSNAKQIQAIGTGLGQAALVCNRTAQAFAGEIQRMTVTADNRSLSQAFLAVMGDLFLSWTDLAGGGGGGGGPTETSGEIGGAAVSGATLNLSTSVATGSTNSRTSGAHTSSTPGSSSNLFTLRTPGSSPNVITTPNTVSKSVSPSRP
jgi:hypothetical protein